MSKKIKVLKYKVVNTNIGKKFIGKNIDIERVKSKSEPTTKPRTKAPAWFIEFRDEQREFNKTIVNRLDRIVKVNNLKE